VTPAGPRGGIRRALGWIVVALAVVGGVSYITFAWRSERNVKAFKNWTASSTPARVTRVTFRKGGRVARCKSAPIVSALSGPVVRFDANADVAATGAAAANRFDSATIEFDDGHSIKCDGGTIAEAFVTFELEDRSKETQWSGVPPERVRALLDFLIRGSEPGRREF
jgi:hypothetical protein